MSQPSCSANAHAYTEPLAGTASEAAGYVLIEQPGSWGREAVTTSGLDPRLGARLQERAAKAGVKVLLMRRPGAASASSERAPSERARRVRLVHAGTRPWSETCRLDEDELARLDPTVCASETPPGIGDRDDAPRWVVCTNAKRDRCCARLGRPIADTLAAIHPEETMESSHLGGHRFAGTMLLLPHGLLYGHLDVVAALEVATHHLAGRVELEHLRGRGHLPAAAQVAEIAVRRTLGIVAHDEVEITHLPVSAPQPDGPEVQVVANAAGHQAQVTVTARHDPPARLLSCDAAEPGIPIVLEAGAVTVIG
ncbi:MAG: sucrase ferredoxin [Nitriliruptoraceae bacterium]